MDKVIIILLIFLLVGFGSISFRAEISDLVNGIEIVGENISGNQERNITAEKGKKISREFKNITGSSEVNIITENGDILAVFAGQIAGNAEVKIESIRGMITVEFQDKISGAAEVKIESKRGDIVFLNRRSEIEKYMRNGHLKADTGGKIHYRD